MKPVEELFLEALKASMKNEKVTWNPKVTSEMWEELFSLADAHRVLPLVYEAIYACTDSGGAALTTARQKTVSAVAGQAVKTAEFLQTYKALTDAGIKPLVVKGVVCRQLYPKPDHRPSSDEDLVIPPEAFDRCQQVLMDAGMTVQGNACTDSYEVSLRKKGSPLYIELHKSLFPPESDAYGDLNDGFTNCFENAVSVVVDGVTLYTLAPEDHLFYLICHAFKHFLHSGFGIRQVCDIVLFTDVYGKVVNWERLYGRCRKIRAHKFAAALFAIGRKWLGSVSDIPACWQEASVDPEPLLAELLQAGIYGQTDMTRRHSSNITLQAVVADKKGMKPKNGLRASVFPTAKELQGRYPYLKEKPWLLPVAWVSRMIRYACNRDDSKAAAIMQMGKQRVQLLKRYEIIE